MERETTVFIYYHCLSKEKLVLFQYVCFRPNIPRINNETIRFEDKTLQTTHEQIMGGRELEIEK